jgi:hypothetical protein
VFNGDGSANYGYDSLHSQVITPTAQMALTSPLHYHRSCLCFEHDKLFACYGLGGTIPGHFYSDRPGANQLQHTLSGGILRGIYRVSDQSQLFGSRGNDPSQRFNAETITTTV